MQNFGEINNAFNEVLIDGVIKKDKTRKQIYQAYLKALRENEILKTQYLVYKNLELKVESDSYKAAEYISENISLLSEFNNSEIKEANDKLISLLGGYSELLEVDYPNKKLHENISFLINNKKTSSNIDKILAVKENITEHIVNNQEKEQIKEAIIPTSVLAKLLSVKFNEKYSELDEQTKTVLKLVVESNEEKQKEHFNSVIENCTKLIDENLNNCDIETKQKLLEVKDKLTSMEYNNEAFSYDMIRLITLEKDLK